MRRTHTVSPGDAVKYAEAVPEIDKVTCRPCWAALLNASACRGGNLDDLGQPLIAFGQPMQGDRLIEAEPEEALGSQMSQAQCDSPTVGMSYMATVMPTELFVDNPLHAPASSSNVNYRAR
ncbi:MAG: hypothetical protein OES09_03400 [Gammaproteobacteria bacterium]|nr:hypothetical protein [Gammaproteobacteria bacterium]